jgi:hypothetical protein
VRQVVRAYLATRQAMPGLPDLTVLAVAAAGMKEITPAQAVQVTF